LFPPFSFVAIIGSHLDTRTEEEIQQSFKCELTCQSFSFFIFVTLVLASTSDTTWSLCVHSGKL